MMRRGHPGNIRWRNENQKHFRPRSGGGPQFRPFKAFPRPETHVFTPPGLLRPPRGLQPYSPNITDVHRPENDIRNNFRFNRGFSKPPRPQFPHHGNRRYSIVNTPQIRFKNPGHNNHYYHENKNQSEQCHINSMGDIDDRQAPFGFKQSDSDWTQFENPDYYDIDDKDFFPKSEKSHSNCESNRSFVEYRGHRPPTSDHYGSNSVVATDSSNTFSRSVNDTVNIVRERLMNRNEVPQSNVLLNDNNQKNNKNPDESAICHYENIIQNQPNKKRMQRHRQNIKSDCDKIKNKIVHQLFKMDKGKIHKLMDNPSSSTKFEYAISSLITESQNSLNRHLRSVAEKSLSDSGLEFIANDDTIYEDTFMKQMQCILDPQDTVLLEDMKPIVMEELRKVLQLNDFEQRFENFDYSDQPRMEEVNTEISQEMCNEIYALDILPPENTEIGYNLCMEDEFTLKNSHEQTLQMPISPNLQQNSFERKTNNSTCDKNPIFQRQIFRRSIDHSTIIQQRIETRYNHRESINEQFNITIDDPQVAEKSNVARHSRSIANPLKKFKFDSQQSTHMLQRDSWHRKSTDESLNDSNPEMQEIQQRQNMDRIKRWSSDNPFNEVKPVIQGTAQNVDTNTWHRRSIDKPSHVTKEGTSDILWTENADNLRTPRSIAKVFHEEKPIVLETAVAPCHGSFNANLEEISDEDDPFAELDKQYHVDVDPSFIADDNADDMMTFNSKENLNMTDCKKDKVHPNLSFLTNVSTELNEKCRNATQNVRSPLKSPIVKNIPCAQSYDFSDHIHLGACNIENNEELVNVTHEDAFEPTNIKEQKNKQKSEVKSPISYKSHKRSKDQRPLHRKEKRKKSKLNQSVHKKMLNKKLLINLTDFIKHKKFETYDSGDSQFNSNCNVNDNQQQEQQDMHKIDLIEKESSDKHLKYKEKEYLKKGKSKEREIDKKNCVSSDVNITSTINQTSPKGETKNKLTNIDMFVDLSKVSYKSNKNTTRKTINKYRKDKLKKSITVKVIKRHVATQVVKKLHSKEVQVNLTKNIVSRHCQTEIKRFLSKSIQTDPQWEISTKKSTDTLERMKEIDLEIQVLLQEKFKLYNSLESKQHQQSNATMTTLGMTVLNVSKEDEVNQDSLSEDAIVEDFTNIPVEELEQIAFEAANDQEHETIGIKKTTRRQRIKQNERNKTESPVNTTKKPSRKAKASNTSLVEQTVTDEQLLEDIIIIDDFEGASVSIKPKRKRPNTETPHRNLERVTDESKLDDFVDTPVSVKLKVKQQNSELPHKNLEEVTVKPKLGDFEDNPVSIKSKRRRQNMEIPHRNSDNGTNQPKFDKSENTPVSVKLKSKRQNTQTPQKNLEEMIDQPKLADFEDSHVSVKPKRKKHTTETPHRNLMEVTNVSQHNDFEDIPISMRLKRNRNNTVTPHKNLEEEADQPKLNDFEDTPVSVKSKSKEQNIETIHENIEEESIHQHKIKINKKIPKKKFTVELKKLKNIDETENDTDQTEYNIMPCSVVLIKQDLSKYMYPKYDEPTDFPDMLVLDEQTEIAEETIVNEFDMLDVSEDIVIGESYEVKLLEDKDVRLEVPLSEEIIFDNSQSSSDDMIASNLQANDQCRMYDYSADESLRRDSIAVSGNGDAVLAIESIENNFLAACLDGNVYYFNGDGQLITTLRGSNLAVTCLTIVKEKNGTTVYTGSLDSRIRYFDLETGLEKGSECNVLSPIQTMDRAWDTIFVGTRTGFVLQFECKNNMLIPVSTVKFSDQSILALRAMKEGPRKVLLVAARSENVTIKDAQTGLLLRTLEGPKMTVYTLLYEDGKVYCGTSSHQIHVFDYTSGCHVGTHEGGKGAVCLRAMGGLLFAGCYDGCVYVYRDGEARPFAQLRGPGLMLLSLAVKNTKIIAGYKDRSLHIWKIPLTILQEMIL